ELFRDELAHGNAQAGAEIDLAAIDRGGAVGMKREEGIDLAPVEALAERGARLAGRDSARRSQREAHDERTAALQKIAPRGQELIRHRRRPTVRPRLVSLAARHTATAARDRSIAGRPRKSHSPACGRGWAAARSDAARVREPLRRAALTLPSLRDGSLPL